MTASGFVLSLLRDNRLQDQPCVQNLIDQTDEILLAFYEHPKLSKSTLAWANDMVKSRYAESIRELAKKREWMALRSLASVCKETAGVSDRRYSSKDGGTCARIVGSLWVNAFR